MNKITIGIPIFNEEKRLHDLIKNVINQKYKKKKNYNI